MVTAAGATLAALLGSWMVLSNNDAAIKLTAKSPAAPPIKQMRRPSLSTIWALMIVPTMPMVFRPPARPFCLRELWPACLSNTGE